MSRDRIFLKPKQGLEVPDPERGSVPLPEGGAWVNASGYWYRRLRDGDVERATPPEASKPRRRRRGEG